MKQKKITDYYRKKEKPNEVMKKNKEKDSLLRSFSPLALKGGQPKWVGESPDGKYAYTEGQMYWTGTIHTFITLPKGAVLINIKARGSEANGVFPYMIIELDNEEIGGVFVNSSVWKQYSFEANTEGGVKVLSVTFANDGINKGKSQDRNLYVDSIRVIRNER